LHDRSHRPPFPVVGLGASAGGLDALEKFLTNLPTPNGMAFVIVTHLDPTRDSLLPEILAKYTRMPLDVAEEGVTVEPDRVYVIPPNKHLEISAGALHLIDPQQPRGQRHPIDHFLRSLARDQGEGAICVILSGTGSDGTLGLKAIKESGGVTIVQEESSAQYASMPLSAIGTGQADLILPVEAIPGKLVDLMRHRASPDRMAHGQVPERELLDQLPQVFKLIQKRSGQDFSSYKPNTIMRRIERRMMFNDIATLGEYIEHLKSTPEEVTALFKDLLIGVTNFFRDPEAFSSLEEKALPPLFEAKSANDTFRVWIAGCGSGEEAYSITMLLQELAAKTGKNPRIQVFATDLDRASIDKARAGVYPESIAGDISPERLRHFFKKQDGAYKVSAQLRECVIFAPHNLIKDPPFSKLDLVCCRNLLIYLKPVIQKKIIPLFWYALNPTGLLFLGASETIGGSESLFDTVDKRWKIFARRESPRPLDLSFPLGLPMEFSSDLKPSADIARGLRQGIGAAAETFLLQRYAPPCVVINDRYEVVHFSTRTDPYLHSPLGEPTNNLLSMVSDELRAQLRLLVRNAFSDKKRAFFKGLRFQNGQEERIINLVAEPIRDPSSGRDLVAVIFEETGAHPLPEGGEPLLAGAETPEGLALRHLEEEFKTNREQLRITVEEAEAATEELKSSNEELMSMNEELQSTNEELETSKEELQALNEELISVNSEIQGKSLEMEDTNSDLINLMESTRIATIFLDKQLRVKRFTQAAREIFALLPGDVGRPLFHLTSKVLERNLIEDARKVLQSLEPFEEEVTCEGDRFYLMQIRPYRTVRDVIDGVVLTFANITAQKRNEKAAQEARHLAESIIATVASPLLVLDGALRVVSANPAFFRIFSAKPEETVGRYLYKLGARQWDIPQLRKLLGEILPKRREVLNFDVTNDFQGIGRRTMLLNARQVDAQDIILLSLKDVTDSVSMEAYRLAKEKAEAANRAKSEFLANMSHEIRTPLTITLSALEQALETELSDLQRHLLTMAQDASESLLQLIEDILDLSKIESGKMQFDNSPFLLKDLIENLRKIFQLAAEQKNLKLTANIAADVPELVIGDPVRLRQVLVNLIGNAIKFTEKGSVSVTVSRGNGPEAPGKVPIRFAIKDSGIGIPGEKIRELFQSFTQLDSSSSRAHGGTGLGLAICKKIVDLGGGTIDVESIEGRGSTFSFTLPFGRVEEDGWKSDAGRATGDGRSGKDPSTEKQEKPPHILIVENDPAIRDLIGLFFLRKGWKTTNAASGREGIEIWKKGDMDFILMDLMMPDMDGLETTRLIRQQEKERGGHIPIFALTAQAMKDQEEKCLQGGMDGFVVKPIRFEELFTRIQTCLG